ncbi:MAG: hypothetical protein ACYCYN_07880, partial [Solirubrobacteraceae bacterium]
PPLSMAPVGAEPRVRALLAAAQVAARDGCEALSFTSIADRAGVRVGVMFELFDDPHECFIGAAELLAARLIAFAVARARRASDWPLGVCVLAQGILDGLAADRVLARACFIEPFALGRAGVAARSALLSRLAELFAERRPAGVAIDRLALEAAIGAVWGAIHGEVAAGRERQLPQRGAEIAFLLLAPALGGHAALAEIERWAAGR